MESVCFVRSWWQYGPQSGRRTGKRQIWRDIAWVSAGPHVKRHGAQAHRARRIAERSGFRNRPDAKRLATEPGKQKARSVTEGAQAWDVRIPQEEGCCEESCARLAPQFVCALKLGSHGLVNDLHPGCKHPVKARTESIHRMNRGPSTSAMNRAQSH
jgi:hypothetical protein